MRSLAEYTKDQHPLATMIKQFMTWDWIFSKWYEKLILAAAVMWSAYSLVRLII